ncbi:hypothetical protein BJ998_008141 [Kutzneria kofuensis]|uniref:Uncharacterized protein n=1 Tax=Kutzneria kofuensis TaxID=103725 RepID=A0A7W9KQJ0_9PSEU|nr:hypothetical protein [Kutzneria kofuensis]
MFRPNGQYIASAVPARPRTHRLRQKKLGDGNVRVFPK